MRLWTQAVVHAAPTSPSKTARGRGKAAAAAGGAAEAVSGVVALPRLLCVLGHSDRSMRSAGVEACQILADGVDAWWPEGAPETGALDKTAVAALLASIAAQAGAIKADSEAAESLLVNTFEDNGDLSPQKVPRGRKKAIGGANDLAATTRLNINPSQAAALKEFLLTELPKQRGSAGLNAVPFVVHVIHDVADPAELLLAGHQLLSSFALEENAAGDVALRPLSSSLERTVAAQLVSLYNDTALTALLGSSGGKKQADKDEAEVVIASLLTMLVVPRKEGWTEVRKIAISAITPVAFEVLPEIFQRTVFVVSIKDLIKDVVLFFCSL